MAIKLMLSGEYTYQVFHKIDHYSTRMRRILGPEFDIMLDTEHYEAFEARDYMPFDCVVMYTDQWYIKAVTQLQQGQAMLHYVLSGGGLVLLHQLDMGSDYELGQMLGVRPKTPLWISRHEGAAYEAGYEPVPGHPIAEDVLPFRLRENLFDLEYDTLTDRSTAVNVCLDNGLKIPAVWTTEFGMGRVVCITPGHTSEAFDNPNFARIIRNSARWAARKV